MKIGFTTSFPIEIIYAAGHTPVDLNNLFITGQPQHNVREAESSGMPRNICSWIKGIYHAALTNNIRHVVGVVQGDCSNTHSLMSLLTDSGVEVTGFSYPYDRDRDKLRAELHHLADHFGVTFDRINDVKRELDEIRKMLIEVDKLTYLENRVTGGENHYWLVNSSDFCGDPQRFKAELQEFILAAKQREPKRYTLNLAYIGVPTIFNDFYEFINELDCDIVFNEVQRQFAMPYLKEDIIDQYRYFTYPYSVYERLEDIGSELSTRDVRGIISYSQAFCHRQIDNILLKKYLPFPFLTIEGDTPDDLDERTKLRLESFVDMIRFSS